MILHLYAVHKHAGSCPCMSFFAWQVSTFSVSQCAKATSSCQADRLASRPLSILSPLLPQSLPQPHVTNTHPHLHTHTLSGVCKLYEQSKNYNKLSTTKLQLWSLAHSFLGRRRWPRLLRTTHPQFEQLRHLSDCLCMRWGRCRRGQVISIEFMRLTVAVNFLRIELR